MVNIARKFETMEDILRDVAYQMALTYRPIATPNPSDDPTYNMVMNAVFQTIALIGDYWTGPSGPQVRGIQLDDVREEQEADPRTMEVSTNKCHLCGERSILTVNISQFNAWQDGMLIQEAFPEMTDEQREHLKTGIHPQCWNKMFE